MLFKNIISGKLREVDITATLKGLLIVGNPFVFNLEVFGSFPFQSGQTVTSDEVQCQFPLLYEDRLSEVMS